MDSKLQDAIDFAVLAHEGQSDRAGAPYFLHVLRVSAAGTTPAEQIVGALHDVIEDTRYTHADLAVEFGYEVADAVQTLSRLPNETYSAFIARCAANPLTRAVKTNDVLDHFIGLDALPLAEALRKRERYVKALEQLSWKHIVKE